VRSEQRFCVTEIGQRGRRPSNDAGQERPLARGGLSALPGGMAKRAGLLEEDPSVSGISRLRDLGMRPDSEAEGGKREKIRDRWTG